MLFPGAGRFKSGLGSRKRNGVGPEMQRAAYLGRGWVLAIARAECGVQLIKDVSVILPAIDGYFKMIPGQSFPDVKFLDG